MVVGLEYGPHVHCWHWVRAGEHGWSSGAAGGVCEVLTLLFIFKKL